MSWFTSLMEQVGQKIVTASKNLIVDLSKKLTAYVGKLIQSGAQYINDKMQTALDNQLAPKLTEVNTAGTIVEQEPLVPITSITEGMVSFQKEKLLSSSRLPLMHEVIPAQVITLPSAAAAA